MTLSAPDDVRVVRAKPLLPPAVLVEEIPLSEKAQKTVQKASDASDVVGPASSVMSHKMTRHRRADPTD